MGALDVLVAYALARALVHDKVPLVPYLRVYPFFNELLSCIFCSGFHAGWVAWLLAGADGSLLGLVQWSLAAAASCYLLDAVVYRLLTVGTTHD